MLYVFDDDILVFDLSSFTGGPDSLSKPPNGRFALRLTVTDDPFDDKTTVTSVYRRGCGSKELTASPNLMTREVKYSPVGPHFHGWIPTRRIISSGN
jgi:hypothetical protein